MEKNGPKPITLPRDSSGSGRTSNYSINKSTLFKFEDAVCLCDCLSVCLSVQEWVRSTWMRWSASARRSPSGTARSKTSHQRTVNTRRTLPFAATCPTWDLRTRSELNLLTTMFQLRIVLLTWRKVDWIVYIIIILFIASNSTWKYMDYWWKLVSCIRLSSALMNIAQERWIMSHLILCLLYYPLI